MRRDRTMADWFAYAFAAGFALTLALLVLSIISGVELQREIDGLRMELDSYQVEEPAIGGAEVPIPEFVAGPDWRFPIADSDYQALTSPFGYRVSPLLHVEMYHTGLDIAATWRAQVVAVADGVVVEHWPPPDGYFRGHPIYGGMITVEHADGMQTLYAHLSWSRVNTGDVVRAGEVLGRVGNTGKSDGQHLHFECVAAGGERLNPLLYIEVPK